VCGAPFEARYPDVKTCSQPCRRAALSKSKTKDRKAACHPDRKHYAKGLCKTCYGGEQWRRARALRPPRRRVRVPPKVTCGHDDLPHKGGGLCVRCYDNQHISRRCADCHLDRPHHAKGFCEPCYRGAQNRARDARLAGGVRHTQDKWGLLLASYSGCPRCRQAWDEVGPPTGDHVISVHDGGDDSISNLQPLCCSCNSRKQQHSERFPVY